MTPDDAMRAARDLVNIWLRESGLQTLPTISHELQLIRCIAARLED